MITALTKNNTITIDERIFPKLRDELCSFETKRFLVTACTKDYKRRYTRYS
jgi:hypothetical protein